MAAEPELIVHHREQLAELVTEAVEIEHNLMCCYLYAAWSLKASPAEGLSEERAATVSRWRRIILDVAIDEMTHFANANNLLVAIGAHPHLGRPNFPVARGLHPAEVLVELHPFNKSTIDHFVFLERPQDIDLPDGEAFGDKPSYVRATQRTVLMPSAQDYATVGGLYTGIREGVRALAERIGEAELFTGDARAQISRDDADLDGLVAVTDLASAERAIDNIVTQGEGNVDNPENSHYRKFCQIRDELASLCAEDSSFQPARPVAFHPVQRRPPTPQGKTWIAHKEAAEVLDLANSLYNTMLRMVGAAWMPLSADARAGLINESIGLMNLLGPVNEVLTKLPATSDGEQPTAGMSFAVTREIRVPMRASAVKVLQERTRELGEGARSLASIAPELDRLGGQLTAMAERIGKLDLRGGAEQAAPGAEAPRGSSAEQVEHSSDPTIPPRRLVDGVEIIEGEKLQLSFDTKRCIHARHCVLGAPEVFIGNITGPWIRPDAIDAESLVGIAHQCPSGAITYARKDGRPDETAPSVNTLRVRENGPYAVHADIRIAGDRPRRRATLCRCGASKRKPFCDGSHSEIGFSATGEPATLRVEPLAERAGELTIRPQPNGPLVVSGPLEICAGTGRTISKVVKAKLCRCGGSNNKPFCDGTHRSNGFSTDDTSEL